MRKLQIVVKPALGFLSFCAFLGVLTNCSKSPEATGESVQEDGSNSAVAEDPADQSDDAAQVHGGVLDVFDDPESLPEDDIDGTLTGGTEEPRYEWPTPGLSFEDRPLDMRAYESGEDPEDPRPGAADGDYGDPAGIAELFQRWTGVPIPSDAERLSYTHELKAHTESAQHHLTFSVPKVRAEPLLRQIADLDNARYMDVQSPHKEIKLVVEPSTGHSIYLSKDSSYRVRLQPRWRRDQSLYVVIDIGNGQVYCCRIDD